MAKMAVRLCTVAPQASFAAFQSYVFVGHGHEESQAASISAAFRPTCVTGNQSV